MAANAIEMRIALVTWRVWLARTVLHVLRPFERFMSERTARRITARVHDFALVGIRVLPAR